MTSRGQSSNIGFGGAVGLGVALALIVAVIAVGHAIFRQVAGAAAVIVVFATIAICTVLAAVILAAVGLLAKHGQLARLEVAERRLALEQHTREVYGTVRAEVIEEGDVSQGATSGNASLTRPAGRQLESGAYLGRLGRKLPARHLEAVPEDDRGGAS